MPDALDQNAVGPIDVAVITFEGNKFSGEIASALIELQTRGIARLIDLAVIRKDGEGKTEISSVTDKEIVALYDRLADPRFDLLSKSDAVSLAKALPPSSSALVLVWENSWAGRFASAVRASKGHVVAFERIPVETVQDAIASLGQ
jgi:uncharacterized membrane protein